MSDSKVEDNDKKYISPWEENITYIFDIIKSFNIYKVKQLKYSSRSFDIIYKVKRGDKYKGIQIKLLTKKKAIDSWKVSIAKKKNKNGTLLIFVNSEKDRFVIIFREDCLSDSLTLNFSIDKKKYEENKFIDIKKFRQTLFNYLPFSNIYDINENVIEKKQLKQRLTTLVGDETEKYIFDILKTFNLYKLENIGYTGNKLDIIYQVNKDDDIRGLQVKTLSKHNKGNDAWFAPLANYNYASDTLLVLVNEEKDRFGLIFVNDCPKSGVALHFRTNNTKYENNKFTDDEFEDFKHELYVRMQNSTKILEETGLSEKHKKESNMMARLKEKCEELKISFSFNETQSDEIDCFINGYKIQCKFGSAQSGQNYRIQIGGNKKFYTNKSDINYFIFETAGELGKFYIIPMKVMIEKGYINSENEKGNYNVTVSPILSDKEHWSKCYYDNFSYLVKPKKYIFKLKNKILIENLI
jgi:hypothetical protein